MSGAHGGIYGVMRWFLGLALGFYFRRIERFHLERVPVSGPVLFASNHPNSLTDSFVIGAAVPRKVNFVATVQLFRLPAVKWLLTKCGVIPINRVRDDARAMRTVADTFEACFRVLERGEAVGIFPEGVTYDDSQLREVKTGAARMALELEHRHGGKLGLRILPVGLTYSAKETYRSDVLVHFGEPIIVAEFIGGYAEKRKECIQKLTAEIERRLQGLILHLPKLDLARITEGVKRLYMEKFLVEHGIVREATSRRASELLISQTIARAVEQMHQADPARVEAFAGKLHLFERGLGRLQISDEYLSLFPKRSLLARRTLFWTLLGMLGLPLAIYGWLHRLIPAAVIEYAETRFTEPEKRKAQASTAKIAAGLIVFTIFYGLCAAAFFALFGWPAVVWYVLSLPVASLVAHYYVTYLRRLAETLRTALILVRAPTAAKRLLRMRDELIQEIELARPEVRRALANPEKGAQTEPHPGKTTPLALFILFLAFASCAAVPVTNIKPDQEILFYPGIGTRAADGKSWEIEISGCVFEPDVSGAAMGLLKEALELKNITMTREEAAVFAERVRWFLFDHERGKTIVGRLGTNLFKLSKTGADGRFSGKVVLNDPQMKHVLSFPENNSQVVRFTAVLPAEDARQFAGNITLFEDSGITVVSDIDDTIKVSFIGERDKLLRATFLEPMKPVPGMPELYRLWENLTNVNFCYLSASPWQLYEPLDFFIRSNRFPSGPFFLKTFRWKDKTFLSLFQSPEKYKPVILESMLKRFPRRQFVLVGDSGELDPEIYGEFARKHAGRVRAILIRDTAGKGGLEERMTKAFRGLPPDTGRVFRDPREVEDVLP